MFSADVRAGLGRTRSSTILVGLRWKSVTRPCLCSCCCWCCQECHRQRHSTWMWTPAPRQTWIVCTSRWGGWICSWTQCTTRNRTWKKIMAECYQWRYLYCHLCLLSFMFIVIYVYCRFVVYILCRVVIEYRKNNQCTSISIAEKNTREYCQEKYSKV